MQRGLKQRIVGALVLLALAVIFLPMLFTRQDEIEHTVVDVPATPQTPTMPEINMESVDTPEPAPEAESPSPEPSEQLQADGPPAQSPEVSLPEQAPPAVAEAPKPEPGPQPQQAPAEPVKPLEPAPSAPPAPESRLDANNLPVSWSVQLASLSNRASAENLQKKLRENGYNAYIRTVSGMNRVFVGPVIERAEADKLREQINRQQKLDGFVVRFRPEQG